MHNNTRLEGIPFDTGRDDSEKHNLCIFSNGKFYYNTCWLPMYICRYYLKYLEYDTYQTCLYRIDGLRHNVLARDDAYYDYKRIGDIGGI